MSDATKVDVPAERASILADVSALFAETFALAAWGRLLVRVEPVARGIAVTEIVVDEIVGDEEQVDQALSSDAVRACLPAVGKAVEALSALDGVDPVDLGGGTFVRIDDSRLAFLPGLVRAPSRAFDMRRDGIAERLREDQSRLRETFGLGRAGMSVAADMETGAIEIVATGERVVARGEQIVLGSFARDRRSWVWGAHNPSLSVAARARCASLLDGVGDRSMWEVSTPGFCTDEATAWVLAGLLSVEHALEGVTRVEAGQDGFVLLGLRGLRAEQ